jgi:hypothetical protein
MIDKELIHQAAEEIDIFEADLTEEFERLRKSQHRTFRLWPLAVAACAAGIAFILLMPPQDPSQPSLKGREATAAPSLSSLPLREGWGGSSLEAQLAHQQEIKEKGERLAAYVREYTTNEMQ